ERMRSHDGSGALAVDVEVADVELTDGAVQFVLGTGVDGAGEAEFSVVGNMQGMVEIVRFDDGQHRPENLFLLDAGAGLDIGNDGGLNEPAVAGIAVTLAAGQQPSALFLADLDVFENGLHGTFVDHRPHAWVFGGIATVIFSTRAFSRSRNLS